MRSEQSSNSLWAHGKRKRIGRQNSSLNRTDVFSVRRIRIEHTEPSSQFHICRARSQRNRNVARKRNLRRIRLRRVCHACCCDLNRKVSRQICRSRINSCRRNNTNQNISIWNPVHAPGHVRVRRVQNFSRKNLRIPQQDCSNCRRYFHVDGGRWWRRWRNGCCASPSAARGANANREEKHHPAAMGEPFHLPKESHVMAKSRRRAKRQSKPLAGRLAWLSCAFLIR